MKFLIIATQSRKSGWGIVHSQLPTFILDGAIQGLVSESHAREFARRMLTDVAGDDSTFSIDVTEAE
jgi:hypothetical protein